MQAVAAQGLLPKASLTQLQQLSTRRDAATQAAQAADRRLQELFREQTWVRIINAYQHT